MSYQDRTTAKAIGKVVRQRCRKLIHGEPGGST